MDKCIPVGPRWEFLTRFNIVIIENGSNEVAINLCFESVANGGFDKQWKVFVHFLFCGTCKFIDIYFK